MSDDKILTRGDLVTIAPAWQDPGDIGKFFLVVGDQEQGKVDISPVESSLPVTPVQTVRRESVIFACRIPGAATQGGQEPAMPKRGRGRPMMGDQRRVRINTTVDSVREAWIQKERGEDLSIGQVIDRLVDEVRRARGEV